ncbi:MAG: Isoprenyl transferase [Dehalococcoidia bacterium]|nr:Isoprenyl transferase [Dehalococcoidia bacterium]
MKPLLKSALYGLYTRRLLRQVQRGPLPRHVALILDGNRRFARLHGLESPQVGHQMGAEKLDELLAWCDELAIPVVTVWALSMDNLSRRPEELGELIEVIESKLQALAQAQRRHRSPRSIHALGRLEMLPDSLRSMIADAETSTAHLGPLRLNIALGYDGREEITQAVKNLLLEQAEKEESLRDVADKLTSQEIARWLYCNGDPDPDLIIRTSGELRLSGFLLWQSAYSELYFCDTLWPAFRKVDFLRALRSYQQRERRFGT